MHVEAQRVDYWEWEVADLESKVKDAEYDKNEEASRKCRAELEAAKRSLRSAKSELYN